MNFMPMDEQFFDEPFHTEAPGHVGQGEPQTQVQHQECNRNSEVLADILNKLLESSRNQERHLESLIGEMEKLNLRICAVEVSSVGGRSGVSLQPCSPKKVNGVNKNMKQQTSTISRGSLLLPPGSRPVLPNTLATVYSDRKASTGTGGVAGAIGPSSAEEDAVRDKLELEAILKARAEEEARIARLEAERIRKEAEEEQHRLSEIRRMEEERKRREAMERKTKDLIGGLLGNCEGRGSLFEDDVDEASSCGDKTKKSGGLFDD